MGYASPNGFKNQQKKKGTNNRKVEKYDEAKRKTCLLYILQIACFVVLHFNYLLYQWVADRRHKSLHHDRQTTFLVPLSLPTLRPSNARSCLFFLRPCTLSLHSWTSEEALRTWIKRWAIYIFWLFYVVFILCIVIVGTIMLWVMKLKCYIYL